MDEDKKGTNEMDEQAFNQWLSGFITKLEQENGHIERLESIYRDQYEKLSSERRNWVIFYVFVHNTSPELLDGNHVRTLQLMKAAWDASDKSSKFKNMLRSKAVEGIMDRRVKIAIALLTHMDEAAASIRKERGDVAEREIEAELDLYWMRMRKLFKIGEENGK